MTEQVRFPIEGMTCTSCVGYITKAVRKIEGVEWVKVDLGSDSIAVRFEPAQTSLVAIAQAVRRAGYEPIVGLVEPFVLAVHRGILARLGLR